MRLPGHHRHTLHWLDWLHHLQSEGSHWMVFFCFLYHLSGMILEKIYMKGTFPIGSLGEI
jgi:hypothetical protein